MGGQTLSESLVKVQCLMNVFFFSSRRRHTRLQGDWSSDVCSSDLTWIFLALAGIWLLSTFWLRDSEFQKWPPVVITFLALLATYIYIPTNCGVPRYKIGRASCRERV